MAVEAAGLPMAQDSYFQTPPMSIDSVAVGYSIMKEIRYMI